MTLLFIPFVALIVIGWSLIWKHDTSNNLFWHHNVWAVAGACSIVVGAFGTIYAFGKIFGGVL